MQKLLEGKKTWIGLFVTVAGMFGAGDLFGEGNVELLMNAIIQLAGITYAMYGNYKAHQKIKELK